MVDTTVSSGLSSKYNKFLIVFNYGEKITNVFFIKFFHGHNLLNLWVMDPNLSFIKVLLQYLCFETNMLRFFWSWPTWNTGQGCINITVTPQTFISAVVMSIKIWCQLGEDFYCNLIWYLHFIHACTDICVQ